MKNRTMSDLRDHIFETIELLKASSKPDAVEKIDMDTAKTIADLAQVAVNSAKLEVDALKVIAHADNTKLMSDSLKNSCVLIVDAAPSTPALPVHEKEAEKKEMPVVTMSPAHRDKLNEKLDEIRRTCPRPTERPNYVRELR